MSSVTFDENLRVGKIGESLIANWLLSRGNLILPVYEVAKGNYKGPTLYSAKTIHIAPDLLAFNPNNMRVYWGEVKHKAAFSWYRKGQIWTTGIDKIIYDEYMTIKKLIPWELYLFFLQRGEQAKDSPVSPGGLYGGELGRLSNCINHYSDRWGRGGMIYWGRQSLVCYASLSEIYLANDWVKQQRQLFEQS